MAGLAGALVLTFGDAPAPAASGNGSSGNAAISADGHFVAFASRASDLVAGDTNSVSDVFVRNRLRGRIERVSVGPGGIEANGHTGLSAISAGGRFVVMSSDASNLIPGDTNRFPDVFVRDRVTGTTERASVGTGGAQADGESVHGEISADGRLVAFASNSASLAGAGAASGFNVFVRDRLAGSTELIGPGWAPALDAGGRYVAFDARSGVILVRDRAEGLTETVSVATDGTQLPGDGAVPTISVDGRFVAFLMDVQVTITQRRTFLYVRDRVRATTEVLDVQSPGNPSISSDGRTLAYSTPEGVFVRDLAAGSTELVSVSGSVSGNGSSYTGAGPLSADGRFVAFYSLASNLDRSDANNTFDAFVRDRRAGTTELVSAARGRSLVAGRLTMLPKRPVPGRLFTVTLRVSSEGEPVSAATVRCAASARGRALAVAAKSFGSSSAQCAWRIPQRARHSRLAGSIVVTTLDARVTRMFATRVR